MPKAPGARRFYVRGPDAESSWKKFFVRAAMQQTVRIVFAFCTS
jgi:hypothetical protein